MRLQKMHGGFSNLHDAPYLCNVWGVKELVSTLKVSCLPKLLNQMTDLHLRVALHHPVAQHLRASHQQTGGYERCAPWLLWGAKTLDLPHMFR